MAGDSGFERSRDISLTQSSRWRSILSRPMTQPAAMAIFQPNRPAAITGAMPSGLPASQAPARSGVKKELTRPITNTTAISRSSSLGAS